MKSNDPRYIMVLGRMVDNRGLIQILQELAGFKVE